MGFVAAKHLNQRQVNIPARDKQFKNIERLNKEYHDAGKPVMSMDVKNWSEIRDGKLYTQNIINVYDHDFVSQADDKHEYQNSTRILLVIVVIVVARYYIFKEDLQKLSDELNIEIRIAILHTQYNMDYFHILQELVKEIFSKMLI